MKKFILQRVIPIGLILFIFCCAIPPLSGAEKEPQKTDKQLVERFLESQKQTENKKKGQAAKNDGAAVDFLPDYSHIALENSQSKAAMFAAFQSYYEYRTKGFEHRKQVFAWQLFSAKIIFFVVIFLVLVGVYFSWVQFHKKMEEHPSGDNVTEETKPEEVTTISASPKEIRVSSPVLGVIILVISLLFFYLYLVYVFPIEEIF